jgi:hypothetical protein
MATMDVYGFVHEDLRAARKAVEDALSICMEEADESDGSGNYFRWYVPDGLCVQIRRNSGPYQRWVGDPSHPWHPDFGLLVWVHGQSPESIAKCLRNSVPGLLYLESKETMC